MPRPERLVLVCGTGTEVGKTWVASARARSLRAEGAVVAARKPAQSHDGSGPTDADLLGAATGEHPDQVCPAEFTYPVPMAPPMAADALGRKPPSLAELVERIRWPSGVTIGIVESAGGVSSPLAEDGDTADLAGMIGPDVVVLVADAGLGTINAVRGSITALRPSVDAPLLVLLNRYDPDVDLHRRNRAWLEQRDGCSVWTDPTELARAIRPQS